MGYYCNECKKTISDEEFHYSMNRYNKALCSDHQHSNSISGTTKDLQDLMRNRHKDELIKETPSLKTVKDWINADFETWDKVINKKDDESYIIKVSEEDTKNSSSKRIINKDKS
jgi:arsenate reductase-like glutaredoxin family protein